MAPPWSDIMRLVAAISGMGVLAVIAPRTVNGAFGHTPVTEHFDDEFSSFFLKSTKKSYALRKSKKEEKPLMVIMTVESGLWRMPKSQAVRQTSSRRDN